MMRKVETLNDAYQDPECPNGSDHPVRFEEALPVTSRERWYCRVCRDHFMIVYKETND